MEITSIFQNSGVYIVDVALRPVLNYPLTKETALWFMILRLLLKGKL